MRDQEGRGGRAPTWAGSHSCLWDPWLPPSHPALLPDWPNATPMCSPWALLRVCVELKLRASLWPHPNLPWAKALRQLRAYRIQPDFLSLLRLLLGTSHPV